MLFYSSLTSAFVVITSYPVFIGILAQENMNMTIAYFVVTAWLLTLFFCLVITAFFCFHLHLLTNQFTTIEFCEKRSDNAKLKISPYDRGCFNNFMSVLGNNLILWCCLFNRNLKGDGFKYKLRDELRKSKNKDGTTEEPEA